MAEKENEDRRCNIVKKGIKAKEGMNGKTWVEEFLTERLECNIIKYWVSGVVIVARVESEEKEREIMMNKNRLRGERVFIENDLSKEEGKIQEKINKWAKEKRQTGEDIKIGLGNVRVEGVWKYSEVIEREEEESKRIREERKGKDSVG